MWGWPEGRSLCVVFPDPQFKGFVDWFWVYVYILVLIRPCCLRSSYLLCSCVVVLHTHTCALSFSPFVCALLFVCFCHRADNNIFSVPVYLLTYVWLLHGQLAGKLLFMGGRRKRVATRFRGEREERRKEKHLEPQNRKIVLCYVFIMFSSLFNPPSISTLLSAPPPPDIIMQLLVFRQTDVTSYVRSPLSLSFLARSAAFSEFAVLVDVVAKIPFFANICVTQITKGEGSSSAADPDTFKRKLFSQKRGINVSSEKKEIRINNSVTFLCLEKEREKSPLKRAPFTRACQILDLQNLLSQKQQCAWRGFVVV